MPFMLLHYFKLKEKVFICSVFVKSILLVHLHIKIVFKKTRLKEFSVSIKKTSQDTVIEKRMVNNSMYKNSCLYLFRKDVYVPKYVCVCVCKFV